MKWWSLSETILAFGGQSEKRLSESAFRRPESGGTTAAGGKCAMPKVFAPGRPQEIAKLLLEVALVRHRPGARALHAIWIFSTYSL